VRLAADPYGRVMVLQVEDTGPGIPEAEREQVFQPFYRALGTDVDGSGLGLAIVKEIADKHGATITITNAVASHAGGAATPGALFSVRFGCAPRPSGQPPRQPA
jgi:two-component system sensor histidine kinase TctE